MVPEKGVEPSTFSLRILIAGENQVETRRFLRSDFFVSPGVTSPH